MRAVSRRIALFVPTCALALVLLTSPVWAQKRPVHISSFPDGAEVFVGDKESGAIGTTPLETELEPGEYTMIFELPGHVPVFETLIVDAIKDRKKARVPVTLKVALVPAVSTLKVVGQLPASAKVLIDGKAKGGLPLRLEVDPGAHQVQVMVPGRVPFEEWVELEGGQEHEVTVSLDNMAVVEPVKPRRPAGPRGPLAVVRAGTELNWRRFRYENPADDTNTSAFTANARVLGTFQAEVAPWRLVPSVWRLWPLTLIGGFALSSQSTITRAGGESANFNQRQFDAGLRYRVRLPHPMRLGIDVGWSRLLYTFAGDLADSMPDVDYNLVRVGLRAEAVLGPATLHLGGESRLVAGGGDLDSRFKAADADGYGLTAGAAVRLFRDHVEIGTSYDLVKFHWAFEPVDAMPTYIASGGDDLYHAVRFWVGGAY